MAIGSRRNTNSDQTHFMLIHAFKLPTFDVSKNACHAVVTDYKLQYLEYLRCEAEKVQLCSNLDDLLKGQSEAKHHGSLRGNHLLVDGVVEVGHLRQ